MNGTARRAMEWSIVAAIAGVLSVGGTLLTSREERGADLQGVKDRIAAVELLSMTTAQGLKEQLEKTGKGYQALYALEADVAALRQRHEWLISTVGAIARKQGVPFSPPPPEPPQNRGPTEGRR